MASTTSGDVMPSGCKIFTTFPDIFFIPEFDAAYHFVAVVMYLSASVALAQVTVGFGLVVVLVPTVLKTYRLDIAAVVMSYVATLLYFLHAIFSALRWKRS
ncbi:hypothetical protein CRUP_026814 [Coryphaenoides rupestris]|nr:hypothetical protein CRUP_026814 [Coryphaenoides rupestris]